MTIHSPTQRPSSVGTHPVALRDWVLRGLVFSLLLGAALGGTAALLHYLRARPAPAPVGQVRIPVGDAPQPGDPPLYRNECRCFLVYLRAGEGGDTTLRYRGISETQPAQASGIIVLSSRLPAPHCPVRWMPEFVFEGRVGVLRDPCHGGIYTRAGQRVVGPGADYLTTLPVYIDRNRDLVILTNRPRPGGPDNAQRIAQPAIQPGIFPAR